MPPIIPLLLGGTVAFLLGRKYNKSAPESSPNQGKPLPVQAFSARKNNHDPHKNSTKIIPATNTGSLQKSVIIITAIVLSIRFVRYLWTPSKDPQKQSDENSMSSLKEISKLIIMESDNDSNYEEHPSSKFKKTVIIATTAALPWMTGTAVNPTLRAINLVRKTRCNVILIFPWLDREDQHTINKNGPFFDSVQSHTTFIVNWIQENIDKQDQYIIHHIAVKFYQGVYAPDIGSIIPLNDFTNVVDPLNTSSDAIAKHSSLGLSEQQLKNSILVLEEPEHLTWYFRGPPLPQVFGYVVGIVHTNYIAYAIPFGWLGPLKALLLFHYNMWMCAAYSHRVIKLSGAIQPLPHSMICNVHGVRDKFLSIGHEFSDKLTKYVAQEQEQPRDSSTHNSDSPNPTATSLSHSVSPFTKGAYFLGKVLWTKGYRPLVALMRSHYQKTKRNGFPEALDIAFYGDGPDLPELIQKVDSDPALANVYLHKKALDHADPSLHPYKVYVNPSTSDVICTATAEALAMNKFAVVCEHPSNTFFSTFQNCKIFRNPQEFVEKLKEALESEPVPLPKEELHRLTWDAATDRFCKSILVNDNQVTRRRIDDLCLALHSKVVHLTMPKAVYKKEHSLEQKNAQQQQQQQQQQKQDQTTQTTPILDPTRPVQSINPTSEIQPSQGDQKQLTQAQNKPVSGSSTSSLAGV